jgi:hypothetical protein
VAQSVINQDMRVQGNLACQTFNAPAGCINNAAVAADAQIATSKLVHRHKIHYSQQVGVDAASDAKVLFVCTATTGGATIQKFGAGSVAIAGAATTITVDLKKNGGSILSATFALDSGNTNYVIEEPVGFTSTALVAGDVVTAHFTLAGANEPTGLFAVLVVDELAA